MRWVSCSACHARTEEYEDDHVAAAEAWNTRPQSAPQAVRPARSADVEKWMSSHQVIDIKDTRLNQAVASYIAQLEAAAELTASKVRELANRRGKSFLTSPHPGQATQAGGRPTISITGPVGCGKTVVAFAIQTMLRKKFGAVSMLEGDFSGRTADAPKAWEIEQVKKQGWHITEAVDQGYKFSALDDALWALARIGSLHTIDDYTDKEAAERAMQIAREAYANGSEARKGLPAPAPSAQALREALELCMYKASSYIATIPKRSQYSRMIDGALEYIVQTARAALTPSTQQQVEPA